MTHGHWVIWVAQTKCILGLHWILNIRPHEYEASTFTIVLQRIWYISVNFTFNLEKQ